MNTKRYLILMILFSLLAVTMACDVLGLTEPTPVIDYAATSVQETVDAVAESIFFTPTVPATPGPPVEPTSIPEPEVHLKPEMLILIYTDANRNLFKWTEDDKTTSLVSSNDIFDAFISDDGTLIAYIRTSNYKNYSMWVVNIDGSDKRELVSEAVFASLATDPDAVGVEPYTYSWVPKTHTLAISISHVYNDPPVVPIEDLRLIDADTGKRTDLLQPGEGGVFYYSPDGSQIAIVTTEKVSLINADGANRRDAVLTYEPVEKFFHYVSPKWSSDSSYLRVLVIPQDPFADPRHSTCIWEIPTDGSSATKKGEFYTAPLASAELSPDLSKIAYLSDGETLSDDTFELHFINSNGLEDTTYHSGQLSFHAWSPDSTRFIFSAGEGDNAKLGQLGSGFSPLMNTGPANFVNWVDDNRFVYLERSSVGWKIFLETIDGALTLVADLAGNPYEFFPIYDFIVN